MRKLILFILLFFFAKIFASTNEVSMCAPKIFTPFTSIPDDQVTYLPKYGCVKTLQLAGHLPVESEDDKKIDNQSNLFYWYVAGSENPDKAPIILWLNGGPGASSFYGFFTENGPYRIDDKGLLHDRNFSWAKNFNYLMIDNPAGVGFSYADWNNPVLSEKQATNNLYHALENFFKRYPLLKKNPLYLSGESYAGKYIPELAIAIYKNDPSIHLQGIIVGDAWVYPEVQEKVVPEYAYYHGLIDFLSYQKARKLYQNCVRMLHKGSAYLKQANDVCMKVDDYVMAQSGVDRDDIRTTAQIDYTGIPNYLNNPQVREALHVDPRIKQFDLFNDQVSEKLAGEIQKSDIKLYDALLTAHIPVLVFNGLEDGSDSNFLAAMAWLSKLTWQYSKDFSQATICIWRDDKHDVAGFVRSKDGLTQVKMRGAGHMAPMDQPKNTLDMLDRFINHKSFC